MIAFISCFSFSALAITPQECLAAIKEANSKHGGSYDWGIDYSSKSLIVRLDKAHKATDSESSSNSKVKRICISSGLSIHYYVAAKGSSKAMRICQITNGKTLSQSCSDSDSSFKFSKP